MGCKTAHEVLKKLKQQIAPTTQARSLELAATYQGLKYYNKKENADTWLQRWEKTYTECKRLDLPEVHEDRAVMDFLIAVSPLNPEFTSVWQVHLQTMTGAKPDFYTMLGHYREHRRLRTASDNLQKATSHGSFAVSFQGKGIDGAKEKPICLCGLNRH